MFISGLGSRSRKELHVFGLLEPELLLENKIEVGADAAPKKSHEPAPELQKNMRLLYQLLEDKIIGKLYIAL